MTRQDLFDTVVRHLRAQKQRAVAKQGRSMCAYRTPDGLKCAIGCLIPDELYDPLFEGKSAFWLLTDDGPKARAVRDNCGASTDQTVVALLASLQDVHDRRENWDTHGLTAGALACLRKIACTHYLNDAVVDEVVA